MSLENERALIEEAKKNPVVFGEIFDEYYPKIYGYILGRVGEIEVAQDLTSDTFYRALKNLWQFQWKGLHFSSWLYRIASNTVKRYYRNKKYLPISLQLIVKEGEFELRDDYDLVEELKRAEFELEKHQKFLSVQKKLRKLPLKYQEIISLRFFEKMKINQIAEIIGKKEGTVKSLLSRGLVLLKTTATKESEHSLQPFSSLRIVESVRK